MPLNTNALANDVFYNKASLLRNFSRFCRATAVFLEAITNEESCSEYKNTLVEGVERDGFDHKVKFVKNFAVILKQASALTLLWNLRSIIKEASELKTYLVKISKDNCAIKRRFFEKNIEDFRALCTSLARLIVLSKDSKASLEYAIGASALEEIQFQEDLIALQDDPQLALIRQANNGDTSAIEKLRAFFNATEFTQRPIVLLNGKLSKAEDALTFIANTEPAKAFTDITQAIKIVKCATRQDYVNLCASTVRLALDNNNELERQITEIRTSAEKTQITKLSKELFSIIYHLKRDLNQSMSKIRKEIEERTRKINRFSAALEDLDKGDLSRFFGHFKGEFMLELFCQQYKLDERTENNLLYDFQNDRSTSVINNFMHYFSGYRSQTLDLAKKIEPRHQQEMQSLNELHIRLKKLTSLDLTLYQLGLQSQGNLDKLIVLLNRFTTKDRPLFRSRRNYDAFLKARDALVKKLRALSKVQDSMSCPSVAELYRKQLRSGFCLFGGQYRKTRQALAEHLRKPIMPSKSSLNLGY